MNESLKLGYKVGDYVERVGDDTSLVHRGANRPRRESQ